jgi:Ca2+-binding RTX toxin-like protein
MSHQEEGIMAFVTGGLGDQIIVGEDGEPNGLTGDLETMSSEQGGNDTLIGGDNSPFNSLLGEGVNMLNSTGGNDTLIGGDNVITSLGNFLVGDAVGMGSSVGGNDILTGGANSNNFLEGDADLLEFFFGNNSAGGNDILTGGANSTNYLIGDADEVLISTCGNDILIGGANSTNYLFGDARGDATFGSLENSVGGDDTLIGAIGGVNYLIGDAFALTGTGSGGNDRLVDAANTTDVMWGDFQTPVDPGKGGHDTFVFGPNNGNDYIYDFHHNEDIIEIHKFPTNAAEQAAQHIPPHAQSHVAGSISKLDVVEVDADADGTMDSVIHFDANNSVTVYGVVGLTAADFDFMV